MITGLRWFLLILYLTVIGIVIPNLISMGKFELKIRDFRRGGGDTLKRIFFLLLIFCIFNYALIKNAKSVMFKMDVRTFQYYL